jgi:predicted ArsR family transcriptional regulator
MRSTDVPVVTGLGLNHRGQFYFRFPASIPAFPAEVCKICILRGVDDRTIAIVKALNPTGLDILLTLLPGPATERAIIEALELGQAKINRQLAQLATAGLISRESSKPHTPNLAWQVNHPVESDGLLQRLLDLADAVEAASRVQRDGTRSHLARARADRLGIRVAESP